MTVIQTNRSHRLTYFVVLLLLAVALTTALVLAGERGNPNTRQGELETPETPAATLTSAAGVL